MTSRRRQIEGMAIIVSLLCAACAELQHTEPSVPPAPFATNAEETNSDPGNANTAENAPENANKVQIESETAAVRFLSRTTFGGTKADIASMQGVFVDDWLGQEFSKPATLTSPALKAQPVDANGNLPQRVINPLYWDHIIASDDQLRQRMAFALSQILVYSNVGRNDQDARAHYQDILIRHAFGNYRELLEEVTYSPAMGTWLTYMNNQKADPNTGRMPDENYAREILQLFSIGLVELNMDGTPKLDALGQQIETYSNQDIQGLAKVFTGLSWADGEFNRRPTVLPNDRPMRMHNNYHSLQEKAFLSTVIPAGTGGNESIQIALDAIFDHPNVAPFISRQLIQRFTQSDPEPAYIERVAMAFELGTFEAPGGRLFGNGTRGDLQATLAAILLEPSLYEEIPAEQIGAFGKVREPILRYTHWARAFNISGIDAQNEPRLSDTRGAQNSLGQQAFIAPSVFNFYRPGFVAPGTNSGNRNITVPEFQIVNENSHIGYLNFMTEFVFNRAAQIDTNVETYTPDYSEETELAGTPRLLVDHLDTLLTGGRMSEFEKTAIVDILGTMPIDTSAADDELQDRKDIVHTAVALVINSPSYTVSW